MTAEEAAAKSAASNAVKGGPKPATAMKTQDAAAAKKKKEDEPDAMAKEASKILVDLLELPRPVPLDAKRTAASR